MARKIDDIYNYLVATKESIAELNGLDSTSKVSIWRLMFHIFAVAQWTLENLFDIHKQEVLDIVNNDRQGYIPKIRDLILNFQYGYDLIQDETYYDNTGISDDLIAASKVVKYVAIVELTRGLLVKVAGITGSDLSPLTTDQYNALKAYIGRIKPPGVSIKLINQPADRLKLSMQIYFNPLILDETGRRIDGTNDTPVQSAINSFLQNQPFNGQYIINRQERAVEAVEGVVIAPVVIASASYAETSDLSFDVYYLPDAGYLRFSMPSDLILEFIPHENL